MYEYRGTHSCGNLYGVVGLPAYKFEHSASARLLHDESILQWKPLSAVSVGCVDLAVFYLYVE